MVNGKPQLKHMTKTASGMRTIDIPFVLSTFLDTQPRFTLLVCPQRDGTYMSSSAWGSLWKSYISDLNIKYGDFSNCVAGNDMKIVKSKFAPQSKYNPHGVPTVIPKITAHWLRHTFATMLYFAGIDILTAKEQLGHADIKTTLEIYTHLDSVYKRKSMNKLDDYLDNINTEKSTLKEQNS